MGDAITFVDDPAELTLEGLATFFDGWRAAPTPERCLGAITDADACVLAFEGRRLVGFATALTDRSLFAFIPSWRSSRAIVAAGSEASSFGGRHGSCEPRCSQVRA